MSCKPARRDPDLGMASGSGGGATIVTPVDSTILDLIASTPLYTSDPNSFLTSGTREDGVWDAAGAHSDWLDGYVEFHAFPGDNPRLGDWIEGLFLTFRAAVPSNMGIAIFAVDSDDEGSGLDGRPVTAAETGVALGASIRNNGGTLNRAVLSASGGSGSETSSSAAPLAEWARYSALCRETSPSTGARFVSNRVNFFSPDDTGPDFFPLNVVSTASSGNIYLNRYSPISVGLAVYAVGTVSSQAMTLDVADAKIISRVLS